MELPSTKRPSTWEAAEENIPDGVYKMTEFDDDDMEDGKPAAKNPPKTKGYCQNHHNQVNSREICLNFERMK